MRNIVLIGWDSVRADHCSCYGYCRETTPFLNKIANKGVKFEYPIVSGLSTLQSLIGVLTGDYCPILSELVDPKDFRKVLKIRTTLADILSKNKYETGGISTNESISTIYGFNKGFKWFKDPIRRIVYKKWSIIERHRIAPILRKLKLERVASFLKHYLNPKIPYIRWEEVYEDILQWVLNVSNSGNYYFLWIFLIDTHRPWIPPKDFQFSPASIRRLNYLDYKSWEMGRKKIRKYGGKEIWKMANQAYYPKLKEKEQKELIDAYDGEIRHVDYFVRKLWEDLKDTDPIFIVFSDHGEAFGEHGFYGHPAEHYEYLIRVPLVIYNADRKETIKKPISLLRLPSTICELAGIRSKFKYQSLFEGSYPSPIVENKFERGFRITVRDEEWKLILNSDRENELYNIKKDPHEKTNLIRDELDIKRELEAIAKKHINMRLKTEIELQKIRSLKKKRKIII